MTPNIEYELQRRPEDARPSSGAQALIFYRQVLEALAGVRIPYLVGGAYGLTHYTGIHRDTKDLDVFLRRRDVERALDALAAAGYRAELTHSHFLGKAHSGDHFVDLIFGSGNGVSPVDEEWFRHATDGDVLGFPVRFCSLEDMIWSKAFIMERERYDGSDVAHLLCTGATRLDWSRLVARFGRHWRVLLAHLVLFGFIYPGERDGIPVRVLDDLIARLQGEGVASSDADLCQGSLLSRQQYLYDLETLGMKDARLQPVGKMSADEIARWTAAIEVRHRSPPTPRVHFPRSRRKT